jgi:type IV pilus assembly protein PilB
VRPGAVVGVVMRRRAGTAVKSRDAADGLADSAESPAGPAGRQGRTLLGELLVADGLISRADLSECLLQQADSGKRIGALLVEAGALQERDLVAVLAAQLHVPLVDLSQESPSPEAVGLLGESIARAHMAVPVSATDKVVRIAVADPTDELRRLLADAVKGPVELLVAPASDVQSAIDLAYRALGEIQEHVRAFEASGRTRRTAEVAPQAGVMLADDAPIVQIVNLMLTQALRDRASDVHIEPQTERIRIRFRIDGTLHDALELPPAMGPSLVSRLKIMAGMNIVERRRPQDGQIAIELDGREIDIRVATVTTIVGEKCVLRILDKTRPLYKMADLGMPADSHEALARLIRSPFGMVLCAGPTGSGKTTTLYASLSEVNDADRNIMTIEDPVEYVFSSINQIQTNEQAGITFADGLKSILRQDPDVILVGEIRDVETARIAVQSALTGHLVLSSLHGTDSAAALHRLLDMGIESFLVASSVMAVVAQRLVRRTCLSCRKPYKPTEEELAFFRAGGGGTKARFYAGTGCNFCAGTGYQDRIGVFEVLRITPEIRRLIVGWATQEEIQRMAVSQGMRSLGEEAIRLVTDDVTTISEVVRAIYAF